MPSIQCRDLIQSQTLGYSDNGGVDDPKREISIGVHKLGHSGKTSFLEFGDVKTVAAEGSEEGSFCMRPDSRLQKVTDFSQHRAGHKQWSLGLPEQFHTCLVCMILSIARCEEHSLIAQQHVSGQVRR